MTKSDIEKCKDLFLKIAKNNGCPLDTADCNELLYMFNLGILRQSQDKTNGKTDYLKACKKYIDKASDSRPSLKAINHKSDGTQFICDSHSAYIFNDYITELDCLPQTPKETSIDIERILPTNTNLYMLNNDDIFIWNNLKQIKQAIQNEFDNKNNGERDKSTLKVISFCDKAFNIEMLLTCKQFISVLDYVNTKADKPSPIMITSRKVLALLLPIRVEDFNKIQEFTSNIIATVKTYQQNL